jgi:transposase-like protein
MQCLACTSRATTERSDRTERGYRRFRCRDCGRGFNERSGTVFNRLQYPTDVVCLVVFWRLRYKLSLRDLVVLVTWSMSGSAKAAIGQRLKRSSPPRERSPASRQAK